VILIDANILIYAYNSGSVRHGPAKRWLETTFSREPDVRIGLAGLLAFVRISTAANLFDEAMSPAEALRIVESWLARENVSVCQPTDRHWLLLADLAAKGQARGSTLMDAHLAALAVEHGATLATTDRGFARFPGVRWKDPLESE
jgi:uncharacterized protein